MDKTLIFFFLDRLQVSRFLFFSILKIAFAIFFLLDFVIYNSTEHLSFKCKVHKPVKSSFSEINKKVIKTPLATLESISHAY